MKGGHTKRAKRESEVAQDRVRGTTAAVVGIESHFQSPNGKVM